MPRTGVSLQKLMFLCLCQAFIPFAAWSQTVLTPSRIVDAVNEGALVTLRGNMHPLAQPQFDRGAAPPDLPMSRMLLVLKRSGAQEAALEKLLDDQQDLNSASYHQWVTPDQFGQQFGPSDQDIQAIVAWLRSHGFQVATPSRGRTVIEFSGTAALVQQAFHTEIHKFTVNGEDHWANASDPQIPAALAPVVEGVASLHNFPKRPMYRLGGKFSKDRATGRVTALGTEFTTVDSGICPGAGNCYFVGPYDFATIYNVLPLWNLTPPIDGTGQSIAIADESNVNVQDVRDFRSLFGMAPNDPQVIVDGIDPGLVQGAETEALLDVEWAGAVAKGATNTTFPPQLVCVPLTCPTGNVTLTDTLNGALTTLSPAGGFPLNNGGYVEDDSVPPLSGGTHQITASYPGDNSYMNSTGNYTLTVTPAPTHIPGLANCSPCVVGTPELVFANVIATNAFPGAAPTGTITFYDGTTQLGAVTGTGQPGSTNTAAIFVGSIMATFTTNGTHQVIAKYSGDANYGPAISPASSFSLVFATSMVAMANPTTVNQGQSVTVTATVTGASKTPPMTGTFQFASNGVTVDANSVTQGTDASGNQTLTATGTVTMTIPADIGGYYMGDTNYEPARASTPVVNVNLPGFNMNINGPGPTITAGQSGSTLLTLTPVTNISSSVALICNSIGVAGSTCSFNPPSPIALSGGAAAATTITITTLPPSSNPTTTLVGFRPRRFPRTPPLGWLTLGFADALTAFALLAFGGKRHRLAARLCFAGFLCVALGCGAGGNGGRGGGGGGGGPTPTSLTLTVSTVKAAYGSSPNLTATLNSANPTTGTISFFDSGIPFFSTFASHMVSFGLPGLNVGTHVISAQYSGDSNNQPSKSGSINLVITGSTWVFVTGTSPGVSNNTQFPVAIQ